MSSDRVPRAVLELLEVEACNWFLRCQNGDPEKGYVASLDEGEAAYEALRKAIVAVTLHCDSPQVRFLSEERLAELRDVAQDIGYEYSGGPAYFAIIELVTEYEALYRQLVAWHEIRDDIRFLADSTEAGSTINAYESEGVDFKDIDGHMARDKRVVSTVRAVLDASLIMHPDNAAAEGRAEG